MTNKPKMTAEEMGRKGGANGRGAQKRRSVEHYRKAAVKRWDAEKAKKKSDAQALE